MRTLLLLLFLHLSIAMQIQRNEYLCITNVILLSYKLAFKRKKVARDISFCCCRRCRLMHAQSSEKE